MGSGAAVGAVPPPCDAAGATAGADGMGVAVAINWALINLVGVGCACCCGTLADSCGAGCGAAADPQAMIKARKDIRATIPIELRLQNRG